VGTAGWDLLADELVVLGSLKESILPGQPARSGHLEETYITSALFLLLVVICQSVQS